MDYLDLITAIWMKSYEEIMDEMELIRNGEKDEKFKRR